MMFLTLFKLSFFFFLKNICNMNIIYFFSVIHDTHTHYTNSDIMFSLLLLFVGTCFHTTILAVLHPSSRYYIRYEGRYLVRCTYIGLVTLHVCTKIIFHRTTHGDRRYTLNDVRVLLYIMYYIESTEPEHFDRQNRIHMYTNVYIILILCTMCLCVSLPDR